MGGTEDTCALVDVRENGSPRGIRVRSGRCRDRPSHGCVAARRPSRGRDPTPLRPRHESPDDVLRDGTRGAVFAAGAFHFTRAVTSDPVAGPRAREPVGAAGEEVSARLAVAGALAVALLAIAGAAQCGASCPSYASLHAIAPQTLPPTARHGLINHLPQYPLVALATPRQRARAARVLDRLVAAAERGAGETYARQPGSYDTSPDLRGDRSVFFFMRSAVKSREASPSSTSPDPRR